MDLISRRLEAERGMKDELAGPYGRCNINATIKKRRLS